MGQNRIIKICCIIGFVLAEIYMVFVVLAPTRAPGSPVPQTRTIIPLSAIPKSEDVAPGASKPLSAALKEMLVLGFFFGPFGACVGLGAGLLIEGARQKLVTLQSAFRPRK